MNSGVGIFTSLVFSGLCTPAEADELWELMQNRIIPDSPSGVVSHINNELVNLRQGGIKIKWGDGK